MYRPPRWDNPYLTVWHGRIPCDDGCDVEIFEAGADAILQGLVMEGSIRTEGNTPLVTITLPNIKKGTWVFVPDDIVPAVKENVP